MIYPKIASPSCTTPQRKKRQTNSARSINGTIQRNVETPITEPVPIRYSDIYKTKKAQAEMGTMFKKKKIYPIAPDAHIPNSSCRIIFRQKEIKSIEAKPFQLRLDILDNLLNKYNNRNGRDDDDDEWTELDDPDAVLESDNAKSSKGKLVSNSKFDDALLSKDKINNVYWTQNTIPDLFKRLQNESWWTKPKEDKPNLRAILFHLNEILKLKQIDSYESACHYVVEIFRTYGIEPTSVNEILDILLDHLTKNTNDQYDICTIHTIAQFMIERKDIIVHLLEYALKCQSNDNFRLEIVNAVKFITDINNSDGIDLVLDNMSVIYNASDENFSLKLIIKELESQQKTVESQMINEGEEHDEIHPLLKKISEERWFPRGNTLITLDYVLDAIILKLSNITKTLIKTLTTHLIQLHRVIGYNKEQFNRVSNALISLLTHTDADYRLIASTNLANLNQETKLIDLALLNSFINDSRILVRTECCEALKKLTGITSETVLKDCVDDIAYLETLSEDNFSLQNYLKEKNRVPTPLVSIEQPLSLSIGEEEEQEQNAISTIEIDQNPILDQIEIKEDVIVLQLLSPQIIEQPVIIDQISLPIQPEPTHISATPSVSSTMTPIQPPIRVEISGKTSTVPPAITPRSRMERLSSQLTRSNKSSLSPPKEQINRRRSPILANSTNLWDSYVKQNHESTLNDVPVSNQEQINDPIQTIIDEHKQTFGLYRMTSNRPLLIPHKISMENILAEQSHLIINHSSSSAVLPKYSMKLSDLNHNQQQLNEIEFVQLLSSLVIRSVQVHKQYEKRNSESNFTTALNVSQAPLHSSLNSNSTTTKLPSIASQRPTTRQFARIQANIQAKATREGINVHKAQHMEGALSNLFKANREQTKSTMISSSTTYLSSAHKHIDTTHAWLIIQLLKSQGINNSESYLQKIVQTYPKFIPILNTKITQHLIPIIWNDPMIKQIISIFSNRQEQLSTTNSSMKRRDTKPSIALTDDDYSTLINREENKTKKFLPSIRGTKMNLPHHILKFGFRELEMTGSELSNNSLHEETRSKSRKRRIYMHMMMPANDNMFDRHETMRNQLQEMMETDYQAISYLPIVARAPMCH